MMSGSSITSLESNFDMAKVMCAHASKSLPEKVDHEITITALNPTGTCDFSQSNVFVN
jgi:hypothetical protein